MFFHFFKSFCDSAKTNLNIKATGSNEHHKIESIFKSFSKAIKMAISKNLNNMSLPTTKGNYNKKLQLLIMTLVMLKAYNLQLKD